MATVRHRKPKSEELFARYIEENPFKPGIANARLVESGMAIWAFAGALEAAENDSARIAQDYELSPDQVAAAIAYYERFKEIIDDRRAANRLSAILCRVARTAGEGETAAIHCVNWGVC